jgi:hypothetical protein
MPFDINYLGINSVLSDSFNIIKNKFSFLKAKELRIINFMEPNLGRLLIHNFKLDSNQFNFFNFKCCSNLNCKICFLADTNYFIKINNNFSFPLYVNSSCDSTGIVYVIKCDLCPEVFYIGESGKSVKIRISGHVSKIKNFFPFSTFNTSVSKHFNLRGHDYLQHFKFFILIKNCEDKNIRRNYENQFIKIFNNLHKILLNDKEDLNRKFNLYCTKTFNL